MPPCVSLRALSLRHWVRTSWLPISQIQRGSPTLLNQGGPTLPTGPVRGLAWLSMNPLRHRSSIFPRNSAFHNQVDSVLPCRIQEVQQPAFILSHLLCAFKSKGQCLCGIISSLFLASAGNSIKLRRDKSSEAIHLKLENTHYHHFYSGLFLRCKEMELEGEMEWNKSEENETGATYYHYLWMLDYKIVYTETAKVSKNN